MFPRHFWPGPQYIPPAPTPSWPFGAATYQRIDLAPIAAASAPALGFTALDGSGNALSLAGKLVRFLAFSEAKVDCDPFDDTLAALFSYDTDAGGIVVSGDAHNVVTVQFAQADTATPGHLHYWLLNVTDRLPLARGKLPIRPAVWSK